MREMMLSTGQVCFLDDDDYLRFCKWKWYLNENGYVVRTSGIYLGGGRKNKKTKGLSFRLHRLILQAPPGRDVDHVNGNRLDNRRANLRLCTRSQNLCNMRVRSDSTTGFKGVSFYRSRNKFEAYINLNGKRKKLGYFDTAEDAAAVRDKAAIRIHGEFAKLNKGLDVEEVRV